MSTLFLSKTDHIPVGYLNNMKPYPIQDWGWLQPAGGMFASVSDMAQVFLNLKKYWPCGMLYGNLETSNIDYESYHYLL